MALLEIPHEYYQGVTRYDQPQTQVEIDYTDPIARGCVGFDIPGKVTNDLINTGQSIKPGVGGLGYLASSTDGGYVSSSPAVSPGNTQHSVFVVWRQTAFNQPANGSTLVSERPTDRQIFKVIVTVGNELSFVVRDQGKTALINGISDGANVDTTRVIHTGCFTQHSTSDRRLFCDGNTHLVTTFAGGTYNDATTHIGMDQWDATAGADESEILMVLKWNRALSDAEVNELQRRPYRFLRPTTPMQYFVPAGAAPPAGYTMPLHHHYQVNIGSQ